jgi:hypothetical protein
MWEDKTRQNTSLKMSKTDWVPVAHACNPSYSGGIDQENHGSKPAWANSSPDPISKTRITKSGEQGLVEWLKM